MSDIIYPTLDLFLYDLRNGLGDSQKEIGNNRETFQTKLPKDVQQNLFELDTDFDAEYVRLLASETSDFAGGSKPFLMKGYYYPVRIGDTYGLLLDCSVDNKTEAQTVSCIAALKKEILEVQLNNQTPSIGQTWMISGQLPSAATKTTEEIEQVAKTCYNSLMPDSKWEHDLEGKGEFLGATIFELWRYRLLMKEENKNPANIQSIQDNQHVFIVLYPDEETAKKGAAFYDDWLRLFCYRNKILWAYGQSRLLKQSSGLNFIKIQSSLQFLKPEQPKLPDFKKLQKTLQQVQDTLTAYIIQLNELDFQTLTIDINLSNYAKRLDTIDKKAGEKLEFLRKFSEIGSKKYLLQVQKDSENLQLGLRLQEDLIIAIRSRVEVEKAERESIFQNSVAIVGVGLGATSILAALPGFQEIAKNDTLKSGLSNYMPVPDAWLTLTVALIYSAGSALIFGTLTGIIIWLRQRFR
ncbi:hypothetical protein [Kamptonema formosum]|uniref:hypothetical protein n=1 Tax=Kamptonema formosum TaxID=331992 RepID=UPI00034CFDCD|nr:hypothetical protein [Oscillatoria sp. PCC 10802]